MWSREALTALITQTQSGGAAHSEPLWESKRVKMEMKGELFSEGRDWGPTQSTLDLMAENAPSQDSKD